MAESELTGQILGERYRVETFLGRGGMADVYKVRDLQRAVFLAMKVLHADLAEDQVFLNRFVREAQTLELLQHPNIVRFYGLEEADDLAFILMDYIDGPTLRKEIAVSKTGLSHQRILEVMQPVCAALFYAHQMGMIHCDIKPANIMIHRNGTIYLADFGISRMTESSTVTLVGAGTPAYMAPEQLAGDDPVPTMDIYALGVVLFEMLTGGKRPFTGESAQGTGSTTQKIVWEKAHTTAPSPRKYNPDIPADLEAIVQRCLDNDPSRRYQTALELLTALEAAIQGQENTDEQITHVDLQQKPAEASRATHARLSRKPGDTRSNGSAAGAAAEAPAGEAPVEEAPAGEAAPSGEEAATLALADAEAAVSPNGKTVKIQPAAGQVSQGPAWIAALQAKIIQHPWAWILSAGVLIAVAALIVNSQSVHAPTPVATTTAGISTTQVSAVTGAVAATGAASTQPAPAAAATSEPTLAPSATPTPLPTPNGGGGRIAFASDRSGSVQVWYMDANNPDDRHQATTESGGACQPSWSPDGTQIAFTTPCIGPSVFYNGSTIKIVTLADNAVTPLPVTGAGTSAAFDPAWSPDGKTLVYTAILGGRTEIRAIDMQDKKTVRVLANRGAKNAQPAWSRDGRYIVYISSENRDQDMLWYMGPNGESQEMLSRAAKYADPVWSPEGTHILSSVNFGDNIPILALFDRSNPTQPAAPLLPGSDRESHGAFSPDGQWIIFWTEKAGNKPELVLVSVDGKQVKQITNNILRDFQPSWSLK